MVPSEPVVAVARVVHVNDLRVRRCPRNIVTATVFGSFRSGNDDWQVAVRTLIVFNGLHEGTVDGRDVEVVECLLRSVEGVF